MQNNNWCLGSFDNRVRGNDGVGSRGLEICRMGFRIEFLLRFGRILRHGSVSRAAPMG